MLRGKGPFIHHMTHVRTLTGDEILVVWGRVLSFPHYALCLPIIPALCSVLTYYSRIMLNASWYLLFSKLCQHNPPNPSDDAILRREATHEFFARLSICSLSVLLSSCASSQDPPCMYVRIEYRIKVRFEYRNKVRISGESNSELHVYTGKLRR